jgi:hypothetical protein
MSTLGTATVFYTDPGAGDKTVWFDDGSANLSQAAVLTTGGPFPQPLGTYQNPFVVDTTNVEAQLQTINDWLAAIGQDPIRVFDLTTQSMQPILGAVNVSNLPNACTPKKVISAATTNATVLKNSPGKVHGIFTFNTNAAARFLKLYDLARAPVVGTDTPVLTIGIPGNSSGAGNNVPVPTGGINFSMGIALAITTGMADTDTGATGASEVAANLAIV